MSRIKDYFKIQLQWQMFVLEYKDVSVFYLSAFQKNQSPVPLLLLRALLCFGCVATFIPSCIISMKTMSIRFWPIFLSHWGVILNMIATAFAVAVSARAYLRGPIDAIFGLPWYVKMHWAMTNIATTIAFSITVSYWPSLSEEHITVSLTLDVFVHAVNIVVMLVMLLSSKQPFHLLHVYQPIGVCLIYATFSVIYSFGGGTHPYTGGPYIYPNLDWRKPGMPIVIVILLILLVIILHAVCAMLAVLRDVLSCRLLKDMKCSTCSGNC